MGDLTSFFPNPTLVGGYQHFYVPSFSMILDHFLHHFLPMFGVQRLVFVAVETTKALDSLHAGDTSGAPGDDHGAPGLGGVVGSSVVHAGKRGAGDGLGT